jgi:hypothetical protein
MAVLGQDKWQLLLVALVAITVVMASYFDRRAVLSMAVIFLSGLVIDSLNLYSGVLVFNQDVLPLWLIALWAAFGWYAVVLFSVVNRYPLFLVSIVGGIAGALSYFAGLKIGAVSWSFSPIATSLILFLEWTLLMALVVRIQTRD